MEVGSKVCRIIGGDGGIVPKPISLDPTGLLTDIAYRRDVVRNFEQHMTHPFVLSRLCVHAALQVLHEHATHCRLPSTARASQCLLPAAAGVPA